MQFRVEWFDEAAADEAAGWLDEDALLAERGGATGVKAFNRRLAHIERLG